MPLLNKYQTPNMYTWHCFRCWGLSGERNKKKQRKRKLSSRSLINKEQMSKENKGNTMKAAILPDQAESTGLARESAIGWSWRTSTKVRAGEEDGPGSKRHRPVREQGVEPEWQKDLLQQESQREGRQPEILQWGIRKSSSKREVGKIVLFMENENGFSVSTVFQR